MLLRDAQDCPREKAEHFFYCHVYLFLSALSRKYSALKIHCGFFDFLNRFIIISKLNTLSFCPSNCQALSFTGSAALGRFSLGSSDAGNEGEWDKSVQVLWSSGVRAHTQSGTLSSGSGIFSSDLTPGKFRTALDKAGAKSVETTTQGAPVLALLSHIPESTTRSWSHWKSFPEVLLCQDQLTKPLALCWIFFLYF